MIPDRVRTRLLNSLVETANECLVPTYAPNAKGYVPIGWMEDERYATTYCHRVAWEIVHGPIIDDLVIDHICHNRGCSNVDHLRLLTRNDNSSDNVWRRRTVCSVGHPYDESNTRIVIRRGRTSRVCRACHRYNESMRYHSRSHSPGGDC